MSALGWPAEIIEIGGRAIADIERQGYMEDYSRYDEMVTAVLSAVAPHIEAERATLRAAVTKAAYQFAFYEAQHRAKGTTDSSAKAEVNKALSDEMLAALGPAVNSEPRS